MNSSWSNIEVELIVDRYFQMLSDELNGKTYSKADQRRILIPLLSGRSEGSIEFKHQNISAVLISLGQPYIKGYLPRFNYQKILQEKVIEYLTRNSNIEDQFKSFADKRSVLPILKVKFEKLLVEAPSLSKISEPTSVYDYHPIKINYLEREQRNQSLGKSGEELVLHFEKWNLMQIGKENLADQVKWISQEEGDGTGFDILSKNITSVAS